MTESIPPNRKANHQGPRCDFGRLRQLSVSRYPVEHVPRLPLDMVVVVVVFGILSARRGRRREGLWQHLSDENRHARVQEVEEQAAAPEEDHVVRSIFVRVQWGVEESKEGKLAEGR